MKQLQVLVESRHSFSATAHPYGGFKSGGGALDRKEQIVMNFKLQEVID